MSDINDILINEKLVEQLVSVDRVSFNISQVVIVTTEDKLKIILTNYKKNVSKSKDWVAPLSLLIAIIATLVTAKFNNVIFPEDTWRAIFLISSFASFIWLLMALVFQRNTISIDKLIEEIKEDMSNNQGGSDD